MSNGTISALNEHRNCSAVLIIPVYISNFYSIVGIGMGGRDEEHSLDSSPKQHFVGIILGSFRHFILNDSFKNTNVAFVICYFSYFAR